MTRCTEKLQSGCAHLQDLDQMMSSDLVLSRGPSACTALHLPKSSCHPHRQRTRRALWLAVSCLPSRGIDWCTFSNSSPGACPLEIFVYSLSRSHVSSHWWTPCQKLRTSLLGCSLMKPVVVFLPSRWQRCLPVASRMVVIKGVKCCEGKEHRCIDYPVVDVLQMIGHDRRPTEDERSRCVLICQQTPRTSIGSSLRKYCRLNLTCQCTCCTITSWLKSPSGPSRTIEMQWSFWWGHTLQAYDAEP